MALHHARSEAGMSRYREITPERMTELLAAGYKPRHTFPHRIYHLPKSGPDGYKLATRMCGKPELEQLWEIVLYADEIAIAEFPDELFYDDDILWHQQHFGRPGQVAAVDVVLAGPRLYSMAHQSDLVQRIGRRRPLKTRVEKRFKGWHQMLLNALLGFALEHDVRHVYVPTAELAIRNTDPKRTVQRSLFDRLHDQNVAELLPTGRDAADFVAFSLHDCYAALWLPSYPRLLAGIRELGPLRTLDEVSARVILENAA